MKNLFSSDNEFISRTIIVCIAIFALVIALEIADNLLDIIF